MQFPVDRFAAVNFIANKLPLKAQTNENFSIYYSFSKFLLIIIVSYYYLLLAKKKLWTYKFVI